MDTDDLSDCASEDDIISNLHLLYDMFQSSDSSSLFGSSDDESSRTSSSSSNHIRKDRVTFTTFSNEDRVHSLFYQQYIAPAINNPTCPLRDSSTRIGKKFRRRFTIPYDLFESIVSNMKSEGIFSGKICTGNDGICPSLLVLGCLRILSTGCTFDCIEELTCIHEDTVRVFFLERFILWGQLTSQKEIHLPKTHHEFRHVLGQYEIVGLPGCLGSIDCVHLIWNNCPAGIVSQCKGKEKVPTLAFQVVVSHSRNFHKV